MDGKPDDAPALLTVQVGEQSVPLTLDLPAARLACPHGVTGPLHQHVLAFPPFLEWCAALSDSLRATAATGAPHATGESLTDPLAPATAVTLHAIRVSDVDWFGSRIGFLKFHAHLRYAGREGGHAMPGIVFCRGASVGILVIVEASEPEHQGQRWVVLTRQPRIPIGSLGFLEIPAGMLDGASHFVGVAAKELEEECGLVIRAEELIDLTGDLAPLEGDAGIASSAQRGIFPSPGGCDESVHLYACCQRLPIHEIRALQGRAHGVAEEGERISLHVVPLHEAWRCTRDMKTLAALCLYEHVVERPRSTLEPRRQNCST